MSIRKAAEISECGTYRYTLDRTWDAACKGLVFVMLNPSTADAELDDPTIRRCISFAKRENYGAIRVVNLFAFRATDPAELAKADCAVGPLNEKRLFECIKWAAEGHTQIVCAWGAHPFIGNKANGFRAVARVNNATLYCLGRTKDGHPRHPLYVRGDQPLEVMQ